MLPLSIAIGNYPHTAGIKEGTIPIVGVAPDFKNIVPQIGAFRRMVRELEFDVCELAPTTFLIARAHGVPIKALPIFLMRNFHHNGILIRPDANIRHPKDLEGKKFGVRAYSVTTGVWTRQLLMDEYGVDSARVTWVVDDEEHVRELKLPPNVEHAPEGTSLAGMMAAGELQAGLAGNAGVGRSGSPTAGGWKVEAQDYPELFPNNKELEADYYARTGVYPTHGLIAVKEQVLNENPWLARSLFNTFLAAKNAWMSRLLAGETKADSDNKYRVLSKIVGDPLPYGMAANRPAIDALARTAYETGLSPQLLDAEDAYVDPEAF